MSRLAASAKRPMHMSIAASVAGTVAVTGTVVAVAADQPTAGTAKPRSAQREAALTGIQQVALRDTVQLASQEQQIALERIAKAEAKAQAKREQARKDAAAKRAAERRAAQRAAKRANEARKSSASRSFSRVDAPASASAANVLDLAAAAASGAYYVHGGDGPKAFDCSGFTQFVFAQVGVSLPHSSSAQRGVATPVSNPAPGDLVFVYNGGGGSIGHVAIYAGNGYWYEASNPRTGVGKHRAWSSNVSYGRVL
jgi:cell wall-associated NlpC family hydrolase